MTQDCIIVGAGISGLYVAHRLLHLKPNMSLMILESDSEAGGRIRTQYKDGFTVEKGAGRVSESHTQVLALIDEMCLSEYLVELPKERTFIYHGKKTTYNIHETLSTVIKKSESYKKLSDITLFQLCVDVLPGGYEEAMKLKACFGFDAEIMKMSADACISMCKDDLLTDNAYYILTCGITELVRRMVSSLEAHGVEFRYNTTVTDIKPRRITYKSNDSSSETKVACLQTVCTIPYYGLRKLDIFRDTSWITSIKPIALHRLYVKYDKPWFAGMQKITTDNYVRYIIPIREDECTMMYYTDSQNADIWNQWCQLGDSKAVEMIHKELSNIVDSKYRGLLDKSKVVDIKSCYWKGGVHVWRPGVDFRKVSKEVLHPEKDIYVCGEGYSLYQDWIEGALDTARKVCEKITDTKIRVTKVRVTKAHVKSHSEKDKKRTIKKS